MTARLRIAVVGSGAIGSYYGAKLAHAGSDIHFLMRSDLRAVQQRGIHIRGRKEDVRVPAVNAYGAPEEIGQCDVVLIALKTTANHELLALVPPLLHERTILLTLQNGLGNEEFLASQFGAQRVLGGLCFICLNRVAPGVIEHYDKGRIAIGEFGRAPQPRTHALVAEFNKAGVNCSVVEDLALERWRKLVWNIPFNGISVASGGVTTDVMLENPEMRAAVDGLMHEVIAGANACGLALPESEADEQMTRTEKLGAYKPSTLVDYEADRPLEIEAIWGEPLRRATAAGAEMARLQLLCTVLRGIDRARGAARATA
jgi:2-dehydropantoate 2-reductase